MKSSVLRFSLALCIILSFSLLFSCGNEHPQYTVVLSQTDNSSHPNNSVVLTDKDDVQKIINLTNALSFENGIKDNKKGNMMSVSIMQGESSVKSIYVFEEYIKCGGMRYDNDTSALIEAINSYFKN